MDMLLQYFLLQDVEPTLLLIGRYEPELVALSVCVAIATAMIALQLAGAAQNNTGMLRQAAIASGAVALGAGIWSMHFIGMLAFELCTKIEFDAQLTGLSLLPGLTASWIALNLMTRPKISFWQLVAGSLLVGSGIGAMHYIGMDAMRMAPMLRYDPMWFAASLVVGVLLSGVALWIRFNLVQRGTLNQWQALVLGGIIMGGAISGVHYVAMGAARFIGQEDFAYIPGLNRNLSLALAIAVVSLAIGVLAIVANTVVRFRELFLLQEQSESRLRAVLNTTQEGIITTDDHGLIQSVNGAAERLFDYREHEVLGKPIQLLLPELCQLDRSYCHNVPCPSHQHCIPTPDYRELSGQKRQGQRFPIRLSVGKTQVQGKVLLVGFITDISDQKAMALALLKTEQQHKTLIANIPGVTFRRHAKTDEILFISDAIERVSGWPAQRFLQGKAFSDLIHPDNRIGLEQAVQKALEQDQPYVREYRLLCQDGHECWVSESARGIYNEQGDLEWIDGVLIDITQSKLRNAEFEGIVNAINRALVVVEFNLFGRILRANENFLRLTGYTQTDLIGQMHSALCFPNEVSCPSYIQHWQTLRSGAFISGEYRRMTKDGQEVWLQSSYHPILDADGKPFKVIKLATNITGRIAMEQDLREAKERAEHAALVKTTFLANMSHEIRTPMNSILGFSELLLDSSLENSQRHYLNNIHQAARSLLGLLNAILDTAKLERGVVDLELADFSLKTLCQQLIAQFSLMAERKHLELTLVYPANLAEFFNSDALRIKQLLLNLVGNAIKFTEKGRVTLSVQMEEQGILFQVTDTGIGIPQDRIEHIFAPFAQADASITRRFGGSGLGTTIARQLTELLGGQIGVESQEGHGSCFWVRLPIRQGKAPKTQVNTPLQLPQLKILVADDVPQNLELIELVLGKEGHSITTATNGAEVVSRYQEQAFDIVLMDVQMPELDGLEATQQIRAWEQLHQCPSTPIIALSASVQEQDRQAALDSGMNGFASKPLNLPELKALMAQLLHLNPVPTEPTAVPEDASPIATLPLVDWQHGLSLWGDMPSFSQRIRAFLDDWQDPALQFSQTQSPEALAALLHKIRGAAGNLALTALQTQATLLEQNVIQGQFPLPESAIRTLMGVICATRDMLPTHNPQVSTEQPNSAFLLQWIQELRTALSHSELPDTLLTQLLTALPPTFDELAQRLNSALDSFDFDSAQYILDTLQQQLIQQTPREDTHHVSGS